LGCSYMTAGCTDVSSLPITVTSPSKLARAA
jgi:hypothetical protein